MVNYREYIDPIYVRNLAVSIVRDYDNSPGGRLRRAAAIFEYVRANISYVPDPVSGDYVARPKETLECRGGDCEDQAILLASLYDAVGFPVRLVLCKVGSNQHVLCEVNVGAQGDIVSELGIFYQPQNQGHYYCWEVDAAGNRWLLADISTSNYLGGREGLDAAGYTCPSSSTPWQWSNAPTYFG
jgi:transglutaminase-like putative cysteine protease